jgi:NAD(P)-dependent dehydrogenase (short-subunit alcohol dehydrogenase family)
MTKLRFDDRVVVVTGGGRGMGYSHCRELAARGAKVVVSDNGAGISGEGSDGSVAQEVAAEIVRGGAQAVAYTADLSTEEGARGAVRCAIDAFGRIDALIHNAGLSLGGVQFEDEQRAHLEKLLAVNVFAGWAMLDEAWSSMRAQRYGRVVLVGSTSMYGISRNAFYSAAKAAYVAMAHCLAEEALGHGIRINVLLPSSGSRLAEAMPDSEFKHWILTSLRPEHTSAVALYLASELCAVTGQSLTAAGGRVARTVFAETTGYVNTDLTAEDVQAHIDEITSTSELTAFATYAESVAVLMRDLHFTPSEVVGNDVAARTVHGRSDQAG